LTDAATAEKVSAVRTEEYFCERSLRANRAETMRILARAGRDNQPMSGDELSEEGGSELARTTKRKLTAEGRKRGRRANSEAKKRLG